MIYTLRAINFLLMSRANLNVKIAQWAKKMKNHGSKMLKNAFFLKKCIFWAGFIWFTSSYAHIQKAYVTTVNLAYSKLILRKWFLRNCLPNVVGWNSDYAPLTASRANRVHISVLQPF